MAQEGRKLGSETRVFSRGEDTGSSKARKRDDCHGEGEDCRIQIYLLAFDLSTFLCPLFAQEWLRRRATSSVRVTLALPPWLPRQSLKMPHATRSKPESAN